MPPSVFYTPQNHLRLFGEYNNTMRPHTQPPPTFLKVFFEYGTLSAVSYKIIDFRALNVVFN